MKLFFVTTMISVFALANPMPNPAGVNKDGNPIGAPASSIQPADGSDHKTSALNKGFAPFDNLPGGDLRDTFGCTKDEECQSRCCNGKSCRSPDALKDGQTCRNGLAPDFGPGGVLSFLKKSVSRADIGKEPKSFLPGQKPGDKKSSGSDKRKSKFEGDKKKECKKKRKAGKLAGAGKGQQGGGQKLPGAGSAKLNEDGNPIGAPASSIQPSDGSDFKNSALNVGFAPFDNLPGGDKRDTFGCTKDEECQSRCCDGKSCRAPDALKKVNDQVQTCRSGLTPNFGAGGVLSFFKETVSSPDIGVAPKN